jgi:hypothetical protein
MPRIALLAEFLGVAEQALHVFAVEFLIVGKAEVGADVRKVEIRPILLRGAIDPI